MAEHLGAGRLAAASLLAVTLSACGAGTTADLTTEPARAAAFSQCGPVAPMTPSKQELLRSPRPVSTEPAMTYEQVVAAVEEGNRRDVAAGAAFAAAGRDVRRLPTIEHPGSPVGPEAQTLDDAVRAADRVLVGTVLGLVHGAPTTARVRVDVAVRGVEVGEQLTVWAGGQVVLPTGRDCLDDAQWMVWGNALSLFPGMRVALLLVPDDEPDSHRQLFVVGGYDLTGGRVRTPPEHALLTHPFAAQVQGLSEAQLVARLRSGVVREASAPG